MITESSLVDKVITTGRIPPETISEYYSIMDILIYPRLSERITELTTPLKPLEAMAMGKNVVISNVGGLMEIVPENCGAVFKAGDIDDLLEKVNKLVNDSDLRKQYITNARNFIKERDWNNIVKKYMGIYKGLLFK